MGQKVNPHGFRVGVIKDWDSRWYARNEKVGDLIVEDQKIRKFLKKTLYATGVPRIEIERDSSTSLKSSATKWTPPLSWWLKISPSSWRSVPASAAP